VKHAPRLRNALWVVLAGWAGSSGCIHNHYYGTVPGCGPTDLPASTQIGQVCEVPSGPVIVSRTPPTTPSPPIPVEPSRPGSPVEGSSPPRVVISQPAFGPSIGQSNSRLKWRRPDPESLQATRVEGALEGGGLVR
jgi:hypothetical protein